MIFIVMILNYLRGLLQSVSKSLLIITFSNKPIIEKSIYHFILIKQLLLIALLEYIDRNV